MPNPDLDKLFAAATVELIEAFTKLRQTVTKAFNQEPTMPRTPENERERYAAALVTGGGPACGLERVCGLTGMVGCPGRRAPPVT
jgi:hypothetical protein